MYFFIFLGISDETKGGYMLFNLITKKIIIKRDVIFEETKQWDWDNNDGNEVLVDLYWGEGSMGMMITKKSEIRVMAKMNKKK